MKPNTRESALAQIEANISANGYHLYVVGGGDQVPRYAYTIGLKDKLGFELILAGAMQFLKRDIEGIIRESFHCLRDSKSTGTDLQLEPYGSFATISAHPSWCNELLLGALDYYQLQSIEGRQIVPNKDIRTIDVPDMQKPWNPDAEPVWQWLHRPWTYAVPENSTAVTNFGALMGDVVTEVARWEVDQWEMFAGAGPDVTEDEMRVVPIGTLLANDPSIIRSLGLKVGEAVWRDPTKLVWNDWKQRSS